MVWIIIHRTTSKTWMFYSCTRKARADSDTLVPKWRIKTRVPELYKHVPVFLYYVNVLLELWVLFLRKQIIIIEWINKGRGFGTRDAKIQCHLCFAITGWGVGFCGPSSNPRKLKGRSSLSRIVYKCVIQNRKVNNCQQWRHQNIRHWN